MDRKESQHFRLFLLGAFITAVMLLYMGVLYDVQVVHHEEYLASSQRSIARVETVTASRGIVTDRNGRTLVSNSSAYHLSFDKSLLKSGEDANQAILRLLELCESRNVAWTDTLPISHAAPYGYQFSAATDTQRTRFMKYLFSLEEAKTLLGDYLLAHLELLGEAAPAFTPEMSESQRRAAALEALTAEQFTTSLLHSASLTPQLVLSLMRQAYDIDPAWSDADARRVIGVQYELTLRTQGTTNTAYVLAESIDTEFISILADGNFSGAKVSSSSVRQYETTHASHILGTVSRIYAEDMELLADKGYDGEDWIGRSGVESAFEDYLRGTDGRRVVSTNADGKITGVYYSKEPQPGNTVELTIDLELQKAVEDALAETVTAMNEKDGLVERGAGAVVEKIGTGEVLALASYPTYDLSTFRQSEIWAELSANPGKPFQNRATQGTYPPGSTFKMLTAAAALEEGVVGLKEEVRDTGKWYYPDIVEGTARWGYNCWNRGGHGKVDVREAITVSCNYFFYEMGYRLGIDRLSDWAARFGFGEPTGIEIGDAGGILASREEREERGGVWYGGDTVMAAIGQSDNLFTPLQLSNYICTLISGGERYETRLLKAVKTYDNAEVVAVGDTKPVETIDISDSTLTAIKEGMHNLTTTGSLSYYFKDCIVSAGAKTGTAQLGENLTDNGMFVCFAPYENPEIAVAVAIEKGGSGSALASTAVKILNAYFSADEIGTAIIPENQLLP